DRMASLVSKKKVPVIVMHIKGTPKNMQEKPYYRDVISEITGYFAKRIKYALSKGIKKENIILDPGIGFGKTTAHNLTILKNLKKFSGLGFKLAIGTSRKSFIGKILGSEQKPLPADERLEGSIVTALIAAQEGVKILRVHDVRETKKALRIFEEIRSIQ
ncbi:MAG: dihydropteroate synthase, partial [Elusimicrobiota bacterium]